MRIILLGAPGSGKGTCAKFLQNKFNMFHLSTGDVIRREIKIESNLGIVAKDYINKGVLIPDDLIINIALKYIKDNNNIILDGFPRTIKQANAIIDSLYKVDFVLYLDASYEIIKKRILSRASIEGRSDDTQDMLDKRLKEYEIQTKPLIHFYSEKNILKVIDANGSADEVNNIVNDFICTK